MRKEFPLVRAGRMSTQGVSYGWRRNLSELNGSWQDVAYTEATDVLIAFKLIATAAKYIEGTLEQTVLQPACC